MEKEKETKINLKPDHPTGNFWIDTGLVVLLQHFGEGEHNLQSIRQWLLRKLVQKTGQKGEYLDPETNDFREYEKVNWTYPVSLFIKVPGSARKIKYKGKSYFIEPPIFDLNFDLSKRAETCDICGEKAPLTDAKMWMYPFIVAPKKFGTFYPGTKRGLRICARCALSGLAGYLGWLFKAHGRENIHFFVFYTPDLFELQQLYREVIRVFQLKGEKSGTAPLAFSGPYLHEAVLGLLLELFSQIEKSSLLSDEGRALLADILGTDSSKSPVPLSLYVISGKSGRSFNMQQFQEFSHLHSFYGLYRQWKNLLSGTAQSENLEYSQPHAKLVQIFQQFHARRERQNETLWREKIAWAILEFRDPFPSIESFLFEARAKEKNPQPLIFGTLEIFRHYAKEVLKMDERLLRTLAGFGHNLGYSAHEANEMGLLYALRNAKNADEFFRVLNDVQFRLELTVPEELLSIQTGEKIKGTPWQRIKTLLSIFAMNSYLRANRGENKQEVNQ